MQAVIRVITLVTFWVGFVVNMVEKAGGGPEKRAEAIAEIQALIATSNLGSIWKTVLSEEWVIGPIIDLVVKYANKYGWFDTAAGN